MTSRRTPCLLCGQPATAENLDHGIRTYIACANIACGDYEISSGARDALAGHAASRKSLSELACGANRAGRVLSITATADGTLQISTRQAAEQ